MEESSQMKPILGKIESPLYALMRFVVGGLFACHGAQKLFGAFGGQVMLHNPLMPAAGIIEFGGGLLIAIGLLASVAAFIASGEMAVAYFTRHAPNGFWPIMNRGEAAVLYCFIFLYIAAHGAGRFAVDKS
jgi:putative oxidoreductase